MNAEVKENNHFNLNPFGRKIMKKLSVVGILLGTMVMCAAPVRSTGRQRKHYLYPSDKADARVGRPLTRVKPIIGPPCRLLEGVRTHSFMVTC